MDSKKNVKINDDLLREILVHLPPKTLFKFMTLSKRWKYLINDPTFLKFHNNKQQRRSSAVAGDDGGRLLALFQLTTKHLSGRFRRRPSEPAMNILAVFPDGNPEIMCVEKELGYFINSSEGLILCGRHPFTYHVMNPVTKKWVPLPPPPRRRLDQQYYRDWTIGLMVTAWEGDNSYIVVRAALTDDLDQPLPIETYSSKTGEWVPSTLVGTGGFVLHPLPGPPLVANGVFHWYTYNWQIALYDPSDKTGHVQLIKIPYLDGAVSRVITRSSVDNTLWFGTINPDKIQIYKLPPKGEEEDGRMSYKRKKTIPCHEWELVHDIDIESLGVFFHVPDPEKNRMDRIRLECFVPNWYPLVLVLRQAENIFLYNLGSNIVESVRYNGCPYNHLVHEEYLFPYLESSCLSSYFL